MTSNVLNERSVVLRLEFSIADAVQQRGLIPVIGSAIRAWWALRPVRYPEVPGYLRDDHRPGGDSMGPASGARSARPSTTTGGSGWKSR